MLSVTNKHIMLSVIMLIVVMLHVMAPITPTKIKISINEDNFETCFQENAKDISLGLRMELADHWILDDIETTDSKIKVRLKLFKLPICYDKLL